jgi:hypothetical protein
MYLVRHETGKERCACTDWEHHQAKSTLLVSTSSRLSSGP